MRLLPLLLLSFALSCTPPIQAARRDFILGYAWRETHPEKAVAMHERAALAANQVLEDPASGFAPRIESRSILARLALEAGDWETAEGQLTEGRIEIESAGADRIWRGDALSIHIMKGDLHRINGRVEEALAEYFHGETPEMPDALRRHLRLRLVRTLLQFDQEIQPAPRAVESAFRLASEEISVEGPFADDFAPLLETARDRLPERETLPGLDERP